MNGSTPRPVNDSPSAAISLSMGDDIKAALVRHLQDDHAFQVTVWKRFAKLDNLRFYALGIIAAIGAFLALAAWGGPYLMRLAVHDVVAPAMEAQSVEDRKYISVTLTEFQVSVDSAAKKREEARAAELAKQAERLDRIEARRRRQ